MEDRVIGTGAEVIVIRSLDMRSIAMCDVILMSMDQRRRMGGCQRQHEDNQTSDEKPLHMERLALRHPACNEVSPVT